MKHILLHIFFICLVFTSLSSYSQTEVLRSNDIESYYQKSTYGPAQQHYTYFHIRYGAGIPLSNNTNEKALLGGTWSAGFTYKLKLLKIWDMGIDMAYENEWHRLNNYTGQQRTQSSISLTDGISRTYQNNLMAGIFTRFYFKKERDYRFGAYIDLGAYYSLVAGYGFIHKINDSDEKVFQRIKHSPQLNNQNYGFYLRAGWNQMSIFARYNMADVFNNNTYNLTPLSIGMQMNLVMF